MRRQWMLLAWMVCAANLAMAQGQGPVLNPPALPPLPIPQTLPMPRTLPQSSKDTVPFPDPVPIKPPFVQSNGPPTNPSSPPAFLPPVLPPYIPPANFPSMPLPPTDPQALRTVDEELKKLKAAREELASTYRSGPASAPYSESKGIDHEELLLKLRLSDVMHRLQHRMAKPSAPRSFKSDDPHFVSSSASPPAAAEAPKETAKHDERHETPVAASEHPVDGLAMAHSLFLAGRPEEALTAFRKLDLKDFRPEDRMPIQCLMASCLRQMGRTDEAKDVYMKLANAKDDEQIADVAQWQLRQMRWRKEMTDLLETIRSRRQSLEKAP